MNSKPDNEDVTLGRVGSGVGLDSFMNQKYKTTDRVKTNHSLGDFTGTVVQSYWHLDGETGQKPHMRYVVRWDGGDTEDLAECEISLVNHVICESHENPKTDKT